MMTLWCHRFFHLSVFSAYVFAIYRHHFIPHLISFLGPYKYLTIWNLVLHTCLFGVFTVNNFLPNRMRLKRKLVHFADSMFTSVALPFGMFVVCTFWTLFFIDRELIFPVVLEKVYPSWLNHLAHTCILPVSLLELYISYHPHCSRRQSYSLLALFGLAYVILLLFLGLTMDIWVYPVFRVLSLPMKMVFILACGFLLVFFHMVAEGLNSLFWRQSKKTSMKWK